MRSHIYNFGSCCIDHVYAVPHFVSPGETLPSNSYDVFPGGKGLNQSLALAHAGATVTHAGRVGHDGTWLKGLLTEAGVDTTFLDVADGSTGHALIQVTPEGENAIVIHGGTNLTITPQDGARVLNDARPGDYLLLQNEISSMSALMTQANEKQMRIILNAAPMTDALLEYPLDMVDTFIVNRLEGAALSGETEDAAILDAMSAKFPGARVVLTLGADGAICRDASGTHAHPGYKADAVDTTGAGDTFTGYLVAGMQADMAIEITLDRACRAAAISVSRAGAASSIPRASELAQ